MSDPIKKVPKKLRDGPIIGVDEQILRWRSKLARKGIRIGKAAKKRERTNKAQNEANAEKRAERLAARNNPLKRKFF